MKKNETKKELCTLDTFDQEVSLWQLLPAGDGKALKRVKTIVNAVHNGQIPKGTKPLSLLITGETGKRTLGRACLRALGALSINELPSYLLSLRYGVGLFI